MRYTVPGCFVVILLSIQLSFAEDWPQWTGAHRDSVWRETRIVKQFPDSGPKVKWRSPIELGYSGPAVVQGKVFVTDYKKTNGEIINNPGGRTKLEGVERVLCLDAQSGRELWRREDKMAYNVSYASGPRCTPTVSDGKVYTLGAEGLLLCLGADDGKLIWSKDLKAEYKVESPIWGFSAHPLIDGDLLYCIVGGAGSIAVALNKNTGTEVWRGLTCSDPGYCPPTLIEHAGVKQLLIWHPDSLNSLNPLTGAKYWSLPLKPSYRMSITAPRQLGNYLFVSGIGHVGALVELDANKPGADFKWHGDAKSAVYCCNSAPFLKDGIIYGNDCQLGALIAVDMKDGKRLWQTFKPTTGGDRRASHGTVYIVKHEDQFFLFSETGDLIIADLSPKAYREISRCHVLEPTAECFGRNVVWSHPAFAQRCVFARNDKEIVCIDLSIE